MLKYVAALKGYLKLKSIKIMDTSSPEKKRDRPSSPFVHSLIQSLTRGEKRFFKQSAKTDDGDKTYLELFEVFENQTSFNDKAAFCGECLIHPGMVEGVEG